MLKCRCAGPHAPPRRQGNPAYSWSHSLRGGAKELNTCIGRGRLTTQPNALGSNVSSSDATYMARALELAATAKGNTFPNPAVGCVIVNGGSVVGEGYHPQAGAPHAEVFALRAAGQLAQGATAYVTLEPCNHYGRTPPCSLALVEAGVARVVVGVIDPNPEVGGQGVVRLQKVGIEVDGPCLRDRCYEMNSDFMERMTADSM